MHALRCALLAALLFAPTSPTPSPPLPLTTIILDVDETLYHSPGLTRSLVDSIHAFSRAVSPAADPDALHREHGSTILGLSRLPCPPPAPGEPALLPSFYAGPSSPYSELPYHLLLPPRGAGGSNATGYSPSPPPPARLLRALAEHPLYDVHLASNSPLPHVLRVLGHLQLSSLARPDKIHCPSPSNNYTTKGEASFYAKLPREPAAHLFDDSPSNFPPALEALPSLRPHLVAPSSPLSSLLPAALLNSSFAPSPSLYLRAKNAVDERAISRPLLSLFASRLPPSPAIADVGAGRLLMLELLLPLLPPNASYHAFESNAALLPEMRAVLKGLGFSPEAGDAREFTSTDWDVTVKLHLADYRHGAVPPPDAVVGCSFADLFPSPASLVSELLSSFKLGSRRSLLYFPLTFAGVTSCEPLAPRDGLVPSDAAAFRAYSAALEKQGHSMDVLALERAVAEAGGELVGREETPWDISRAGDPYMWSCMLHFLGTSCLLPLLEEGLDASGWLRRLEEKSSLYAFNRDLLWEFGASPEPPTPPAPRGVVFKGPREVALEPLPRSSPPAPRHVSIATSHSLVSSGTELKMFRGDFSTDAPLDSTLETFEAPPSYPFPYGYSSVGVVTAVGDGVPDHYLGRVAFSFSPHASHVSAPLSAVHLVPPGVSPLAATFLPAIETALSLVHDAQVKPGERVGVVGQGLIGLLVTAVLKKTTGARVTAVEMLRERQAMAIHLGADEVVGLGSGGVRGMDLDAAIDVTGVGAGLQTAIDATGKGGRVVIGSLFGEGEIGLRLGVDFHRSKKTLVVSQVSEIGEGMGGRWTKERRFGLCWELLRGLDVERLVDLRVGPEECQGVYERLDRGKSVCALFDW